MYYIPILLTVIANVLYHIAQKNTSAKINPIFSLIVTYGVALFVCIVIFLFMHDNKNLHANIKELNWSNTLLGASIVLLELGFLLAYRFNWNVGTASIISTILVTIILIPIGIIFFKEDINLKNIAGILVSIIGIVLINSK